MRTFQVVVIACLFASSGCDDAKEEVKDDPGGLPEATEEPAEAPGDPQGGGEQEKAAAEPQLDPFSMPKVQGRVFFEAPDGGATVEGKPDEDGKVAVDVEMGLEGMKIAPAGPIVQDTGHHHVLIDAPAMTAGQVIPADEKHVHFGTGATEATLKLEPGQHRLTLQFADGAHRSYGPAWSKTITVDVKATN